MEITQEIAQKVLDTVNVGLVQDIGDPIPRQMCVEAGICYAMGLPHDDNPLCVSPALLNLKIILNDSNWSSKSVRASGLRELALLQLGTAGVLDEIEFAKKLVLLVINKCLPPMLRNFNMNQQADACELAKDLDTAHSAARASCDVYGIALAAVHSAAHAAYTICSAVVYGASSATVYAACDYAYNAAYDAVCSSPMDDNTLLSFPKDVAEILIAMKVPGVQWLSLLTE
jgi:hypothetical protein